MCPWFDSRCGHHIFASVVELVDTPDLGSGAFGVRVRVSPLAPPLKPEFISGFFISGTQKNRPPSFKLLFLLDKRQAIDNNAPSKHHADVAELVDAQGSGLCGVKPVGVQVSPSAPLSSKAIHRFHPLFDTRHPFFSHFLLSPADTFYDKVSTSPPEPQTGSLKPRKTCHWVCRYGQTRI